MSSMRPLVSVDADDDVDLRASNGTRGGPQGKKGFSVVFLMLTLVVGFLLGASIGFVGQENNTPQAIIANITVPFNEGARTTQGTVFDKGGRVKGGEDGNEGVGAVLGRLRKARGVIAGAIDELVKYYDGDEAILQSNKMSPTASGDDKILIAKMRRALIDTQDRRKFAMSVGGSSVSAGHDNYGNDAWPIVLGKFMSPLWESAGVNYTMRNQAVGGRNPNPHVLCLEPMLGSDSDIVLREWEYWEFSEGFERRYILEKEKEDNLNLVGPGPRDPKAQVAGLEVFFRMALGLKSQPAVHLLFLQIAEPPEQDKFGFLSNWLAKDGVLGAYGGSTGKYAINAFGAFNKPFNHLRKKAPWPRDLRDLRDGNLKTCPDDARWNVGDCPVSREKQDGYHSGTLMINWHPGPLGHSTIARQLAYYYSKLMLQAIDSLVADLKDADSKKLNLVRQQALSAASPNPLPPPSICNPQLCQNTPTCAYSYLPKAHGPDVGDWMINDTAHEWFNGIAPNQDVCDINAMFRMRCFKKHNAHNEDCERCRKRMSFRDQKRAFLGAKDSGVFSFKTPVMKQCQIWICEPPYEWRKDALKIANFNTDVRFKVNGKECNKANKCYTVHQVHYKQCGILNVADITGGSCLEKSTRVDLWMQPAVRADDDSCLLPGDPKDKNGCRFGGNWDSMGGSEKMCRREEGNICKVNLEFHRNIDEVVAYISEIITL
ncbi:hypothetical protein AAMO2058_000661500 [Amorphochlora amoebiformis]